MPDSMVDTGADTNGDIRWLTYSELGIARNISRRSAVRLAFKEGWTRTKGNDGTARVAVPVAAIMPREPTSHVGDGGGHNGRHDDAMAFSAALEAVKAAHAGQVAALEVTISAQAQAIAAAEGRLQAAQVELRQVGAAADEARRHAREAEDALAALRRADEARKARGRLTRAWLAWRGR